MENRCVCCNEQIPEGRMVCPTCEKQSNLYLNNKKCPLKSFGHCIEENCGWWCEWNHCCAMVTIPAEISNRISDLIQSSN